MEADLEERLKELEEAKQRQVGKTLSIYPSLLSFEHLFTTLYCTTHHCTVIHITAL